PAEDGDTVDANGEVAVDAIHRDRAEPRVAEIEFDRFGRGVAHRDVQLQAIESGLALRVGPPQIRVRNLNRAVESLRTRVTLQGPRPLLPGSLEAGDYRGHLGVADGREVARHVHRSTSVAEGRLHAQIGNLDLGAALEPYRSPRPDRR